MESGKVKFFNSTKGFGFIVSDTGTEYFVHVSDLASENAREIKENDQVQFSIGATDRGDKAINVVLL